MVLYLLHKFHGLGKETFYGPDTIAYIMPVERSVDVDTVFDLTLVQALLN
jgi:CMP-N,N'-diacetyllegionaminic acid synthase